MALKDSIKKFPETFATRMGAMFKEIGEQITDEFVAAVKDASMEEIVDLRMVGAGKPKRRKAAKKNARGRGGKKGARKAAKKPARGRKAAGTKKGAKNTRLQRRTPEQIAKTIGRVVKLLKKNPDGLRSEAIRTKLGLDVREVPRVLREAVATGGVVVLSGNKRSTTYGVGGKRKSAKRARKSAKAKKTTARKPTPKKRAVKKPSAKKPVKKTAKRAPKKTAKTVEKTAEAAAA